MAQAKNPGVPAPNPEQLNRITAQLRRLNIAYKAATEKPPAGEPEKRSK